MEKPTQVNTKVDINGKLKLSDNQQSSKPFSFAEWLESHGSKEIRQHYRNLQQMEIDVGKLDRLKAFEEKIHEISVKRRLDLSCAQIYVIAEELALNCPFV